MENIIQCLRVAEEALSKAFWGADDLAVEKMIAEANDHVGEVLRTIKLSKPGVKAAPPAKPPVQHSANCPMRVILTRDQMALLLEYASQGKVDYQDFVSLARIREALTGLMAQSDFYKPAGSDTITLQWTECNAPYLDIRPQDPANTQQKRYVAPGERIDDLKDRD